MNIRETKTQEVNEGIINGIKSGAKAFKNAFKGANAATKAGKTGSQVRKARNVTSAFGTSRGSTGASKAGRYTKEPNFIQRSRFGKNIEAGREGKYFMKYWNRVQNGKPVSLSAFYKPETFKNMDPKVVDDLSKTTVWREGKVWKVKGPDGKVGNLKPDTVKKVEGYLRGASGNVSRMQIQRDAYRLQKLLAASLVGTGVATAAAIKGKGEKNDEGDTKPINPQPAPQPQPEPQPAPEPNPTPDNGNNDDHGLGWDEPQEEPREEPVRREIEPLPQLPNITDPNAGPRQPAQQSGLAGETDPLKRAQAQLADPTKQQQLRMNRQNQGLVRSAANGNDARMQRKAQQMVNTARGTTLQNQLNGRFNAAQSLQNQNTVNEKKEIKGAVSLMERMNKIQKGEILRG